ncbi:MAG: NADH:flavin oxidoreductase/NADH oxidase family protein [Myxococcota bacterium]
MTLDRPLTLHSGATLANRIAKAAMSERIAAPGGAPSRELLALYDHWAHSGAGLLITGNVMVDPAELGETGNVAVDDERHLPGLKAWARHAKGGGATVWVQINHPGRQAPWFLSRRPVAPSAIAMKGFGSQFFAKPRELHEDEIWGIVHRFARTASILETAGFDGVQIHGAHGYLISQFLSPITNQRTDEWGGSPERRRRFLLEVIRAIRSEVSPSFAVALKLNSADFQRGGFSEEESMAVVSVLDGKGLDLLEVSGGTYETAAMMTEPKAQSTRAREAFFLEYAEKVRSRTRVPLMVTGGFRSSRGMRDALDSGAVDVVGIARPLAIEPDLPRRLLADETSRARSIQLATGFKNLDTMIQGSWYQAQLERMSQGRVPDPKAGRLLPVLRYFLPREGHPIDAPETRQGRAGCQISSEA